MDPPLAVPAGVGEALKRGWLGKKSGRGCYVHAAKGKPAVNEELVGMLSREARGTTGTPEDIHWRLVLPMVNEAARLLAEGVADSAETVDLATVFGLGFAPFRGGLAHFADSVGTQPIVQRLEDLAARHGPRFAPSPLLKQLAREGRPLADFKAVMAGHDPAPRVELPAVSRETAQAAVPVFRSPDA